MFAYCNNNPVNLVDENGEMPVWLAVGLINFGSSLASDIIVALATGEDISWGRSLIKASANGVFAAVGNGFDLEAFATTMKTLYAFTETLIVTGDPGVAATAAVTTIVTDNVSGALGNVGKEMFQEGGEIAGAIGGGYFGTGMGIVQGGIEYGASKFSFGKYAPAPIYSHSDPLYSHPDAFDRWVLDPDCWCEM